MRRTGLGSSPSRSNQLSIYLIIKNFSLRHDYRSGGGVDLIHCFVSKRFLVEPYDIEQKRKKKQNSSRRTDRLLSTIKDVSHDAYMHFYFYFFLY